MKSGKTGKAISERLIDEVEGIGEIPSGEIRGELLTVIVAADRREEVEDLELGRRLDSAEGDRPFFLLSE